MLEGREPAVQPLKHTDMRSLTTQCFWKVLLPTSIIWLSAFAAAFSGLAAPTLTYVPSQVQPPSIQREFRGAWVATVGNIDWPSKPGLTTAQQKAELVAILDRAAYLRLNAIIFQVRPVCDAFYASHLEPWSEYLTGQMGQPPKPAYDPLAFAVEEAHQRGLELHAWFNPYRARHTSAKSPIAANHVSKVHPEMVKSYGAYLWLDPGDKKVQDYIVKIVVDVTRRYDIDAVHLDDYFYPPRQDDVFGRALPFPDWSSWKAYLKTGGKLNREDWRRNNVNMLIQRLHGAIKNEKPFVKFGISPSGIWRPGNPPQIKGFDPYAQIFADSRHWLVNGWIDYFAPQLYWEIKAPGQSYPVLLKWWAEQNIKNRHLWPGNAVSRLGKWPATEILEQIRLTRLQPGASGNILWDFKPLLHNEAGIVDALRKDLYAQPALTPAFPWLLNAKPQIHRLAVAPGEEGKWKIAWETVGPDKPRLWVLQTKAGAEWRTEILPGMQQSVELNFSPKIVALAAVDRCGNASHPAVKEQQLQP
jgi:uncharacterized lipoprotein YddW (UPF0748 family)